jgi:Tfp pilus assembly protein PilO
MNLESLKNMDVNDLLAKLKGQSDIFKDKKLMIKIGVGLGAILIFLIIYYGFVNPVVKEQKIKIAEMEDYQNKIITFTDNMAELNQLIKKIQPEYEKNSKLFHSAKEVEGLYQNISNFAISNGLNILNLKVQDPVPVARKNQNTDPNQDPNQNQDPNNPNANAEYYKIPVSFEIQGNYLGYLKYRRALSRSNKVINFDTEKVSVNDNGGITAKGTLSIVGLPDEYNK